MAVLPARLVEELDAVGDALLNNKDMSEDEKTSSHKEWAMDVKARHPELNKDNVQEILRDEVGDVFVEVLRHAGVYKCDEAGRKAFDKFVEQV